MITTTIPMVLPEIIPACPPALLTAGAGLGMDVFEELPEVCDREDVVVVEA